MTENTPKVSVIIPVYKAEKYIERCVHSLMNQTFKNFELIFVDDSSPDNSMQLIRQALSSYSGAVKYLSHKKNLGSSQARATGLAAAIGEWIGWCDADDWCAPDMYAKLYSTAIKSGADIVACDYIENSETNKVQCTYPYNEEHKESIFNPYGFGNIFGALWNKLIRKSLYDDYHIAPIEGINMWEDSTLTMRLRWYSRKTVILHEPLYHYWVGERNSVFFSEKSLRQVDEMVCAVHFFEDFFVQIGALETATPLLNRLKLLCKERLMSVPTRQGLEKWRNIFPENDKNVWYCRDYSLTTKIKITLLHYLPQRLAWNLFKLRRKK